MAKRITIALLCLMLLVAALMGISTRHINDDLYLGFCSGRSTMSGLLGKPDTWSFNTNDEIYVECSWFSYLLYYLAYLKLGYLGPVLIKIVLLLACFPILYFRCAAFGIPLLPILASLVLATLSLGPFLLIRGDNFALLYLVLLGAFLTGKPEWGRWRQIGAFATFVLWSNGHGSFGYGFLLIQTRFVLELIAKYWQRFPFIPKILQDRGISGPHLALGSEDKPRQIDAMGWLLTSIASVLALAWLNPYGLMILRPVRRTMSETFVTNTSLDWLSVPASIYRDGLESISLAFLVFLLIVAAALVIAIIGDGLSSLKRMMARGGIALMMELVMAGSLTLLALKHYRLILLASFALVPLASLALYCMMESLKKGVAKLQIRMDLIWHYGAVLSTVALALLLFHFYNGFVIRYVAGNPFREDRPLVERLMTFPGYKMEVADFMKKNHLSGRVFAGWSISIILLFHNPDVQVFMDCRDSAMYDDDVMAVFLEVLYGSGSDHGRKASRILEQFGVRFVLLDAHGSDWNLAVQLMKSKNWLPVYKDEESVLLATRDSDVAEAFYRTGNLEHLEYYRPEARMMCEALASIYNKGHIPEKLASELKTIVSHQPAPLLYSLIASAPSSEIRCDDQETKDYLEKELSRLLQTNFSYAGGARVLESRIMILRWLNMNRRKCEPETYDQRYARMIQEQKSTLTELSKKYY